jgi:hypothetical protein
LTFRTGANSCTFPEETNRPVNIELCHPADEVEGELPLNSWSRETFEVYYYRKRENKHEESAKNLHRRV